ncbi:MAG: rhodanese-like domain-containing protein [Vicinamibacteria bacterium]
MVKRVSPQEAKDLIDGEGYVYVDVRSIPEWSEGHPAGSFNVPLMHMGPAGMAPNPDFLAVMEKSFAKDRKLVLGCKGGGRSLRAAGMLEQAGWQTVVDQRAGFDGGGEPGWRPAGLPVSSESDPAHSYDGLKGQ